jgi:dephospho-CoA kinase
MNMSAWKGKKIIGLTGNIATGKTVVRKMLEHLGAYGIDADSLSHRVIAKGAPGYQAVVDAFGKWVLGAEGQIDRSKLGKIVFADPAALAQLESIVHPLVRQAVEHLVSKSKRQVVVIEAIKLLESPLREYCDTIWVATAIPEIQLARLMQKRNMDETIARERMNAQSPQKEKEAAANVIIKNVGSFEDTWKQVKTKWDRMIVTVEPKTEPIEYVTLATRAAPGAIELSVERAGPQQAEQIAEFITRLSLDQYKLERADVMAMFGEKAFLLLKDKEKLVGLVGWQVENLVARTDEVWLEPGLPLSDSLRFLITEVEEASKELQSEASLVYVKPEYAKAVDVWSRLGYEVRTPKSLNVNAWREAAEESFVEDAVMLFKQLRVDRVLRPI